MTAFHLTQRGAGWREAYAEQLRHPDTLLTRPDVHLLKTGRSGRIVGIVDVAGTPLAVKVFVESPAVDALQAIVFGSAAARAARGIARFAAAGLGAPTLVGVLERGGRRRRSCLVTEAVAGRHIQDLCACLDRTERRRLAQRLGGYVRDIHASGLYPQDLSAANLLVVDRGGERNVVLVDLDRVRKYSRVSWQRRCKNLVQLERTLGRLVGPRERLCFLRTYLGSVPRQDLRRAAADVMAAVRRRDARARRRPTRR